MYKIPALFLLSFIFSYVSAQPIAKKKKTDSLLLVIASLKEDTSKALALLTLGATFESSNQDSAAYYLKKGLELAELLKYNTGIYYYYQHSTVLSYTKGEYDKALQQALQGLAMARQIGDSVKVVTMLNNTGIIAAYFGEYKNQLEINLQIVNAVEKNTDSAMISGAYHNLANTYQNLGQYKKSIDAAIHSIYIDSISSKKNKYINRVYATLAQGYQYAKIFDKALHFFNIAISESQRLEDSYAEAMIYGYKCQLLASTGQYAPMLNTALQSLKLAEQLQSRQLKANSLYNFAYAKFLNGDNSAAKKNIMEAISIAKEDSLRDELKNAYIILSHIASREGDFATAVFAREQADSILETAYNKEVLKSAADLEKKYETEKKDNQIKLQQAQIKQKNTINYILIGSAAALLLISLLTYRNYQHKQKLQQQRINELETQQQLTATEAVLKGEEQERTRLAKDLHDGLGGMLSGIKYSLNTMKGNLIMTADNAQAFERSMDMLDSSIQEMRRVAHNMMPEALVKFGLDTALKDFCNHINQSGALKVNYQSIGLENSVIEQTTAITVYRIVQELVNNTMKHATATKVIVQVSKTDEQLAITVEDDGKGFDTATLKETKGIGWANIQSRVDFLKGKLDVNSSAVKGTSVLIEFKI